MNNEEQLEKMDAFARTLKDWRKTHRLTQSQAAKILRIKYSSFRNYENVLYQPSPERQKKIIDIINSTVDIDLPPTKKDNTLPKKIAEWQKKWGLSIREAEEILGIEHSRFCKYQSGQMCPQKDRREEIIKKIQDFEKNPAELERRELICTKLKEWRNIHNLSFEQAARILDIHSSVLANYERKKYRPRSADLKKLEKIIYDLDINIEEIKSKLFIGERLKSWRRKKQLTQEKAGNILSISGASISTYERNTKIPVREVKERILKIIEKDTKI